MTVPRSPETGNRLCRPSGLSDAQVRVLADQWGHLAEADLAAGQRLVVVPLKADQFVDRERDPALVDFEPEPVRTLCVVHVRDRVRALGDEVVAVALAQVAGVEGAFGRPAPAEVREVVGVQVAVVVLLVRAAPGGEVEELLTLAAAGMEEQDAEAGLVDRPEVPLDGDVLYGDRKSVV